jgi:hypothetical protein
MIGDLEIRVEIRAVSLEHCDYKWSLFRVRNFLFAIALGVR